MEKDGTGERTGALPRDICVPRTVPACPGVRPRRLRERARYAAPEPARVRALSRALVSGEEDVIDATPEIFMSRTRGRKGWPVAPICLPCL